MNEDTPTSSGDDLPPGAVPARNGGYLVPFKPGQSGNPKGRPAAGATELELFNQLAAENYPHGPIRARVKSIIDDPNTGALMLSAAIRLLRKMENPDLADFEGYLEQGKTLGQLRDAGINTAVVRKAKVKTTTNDRGDVEVTREIELRDTSGEEFDRMQNYTNGRPVETIRTEDPNAGEKIVTFAAFVAALLQSGQPIETWPIPARAYYERHQLVEQAK